MRPRTPLVLVSLLLLLSPMPTVAQDGSVSVDVGAVAGGEPVETATPGQEIVLVSNVTVPERNDTAWRVFLNGTVNGTQVGSVEQLSDGGTVDLFFQFDAPQQPGDTSIDWTVTVQSKNLSANRTNDTSQNETSGNQTSGNETQGNQTSDGNATATWRTETVEEGSIPFTVERLTPPPQPGLPWGWILGIGAVVLAGGAGAYWWTQRDTQIRGQARSRAMQDLEGESFDAGAGQEPEVHPQVKILEARADDVRRMIELAKDRYERGDLTEHQYETIRERKEAELEEIQAEIDEYREG